MRLHIAVGICLLVAQLCARQISMDVAELKDEIKSISSEVEAFMHILPSDKPTNRQLNRQNDEITCTTNTAGRKKNTACKFPFKYRGKLFTTCTPEREENPWCSTSTDANGNHLGGHWGYCPSTCKSDPCTNTVGGKATAGSKCQFPFRYKGKMYDNCTRMGHSRPWCSTEVDAQRNYVKWGECDVSCDRGEYQLHTDLFVEADGAGGSEKKIGTTATREECLSKCYARQLNGDTSMNGATWGKANECFCEYRMNRRSASEVWSSSFFIFKDNKPLLTDHFSAGDGGGGSEKKIGKYASEGECLLACYSRKLTQDPTVNGATFGTLNRENECYCESSMNTVKGSDIWRTSYFTHKPVTPPKPSIPISCSFEERTLCGWTLGRWEVGQMTPSMGTGPDSSPNGQGNFLFFEASGAKSSEEYPSMMPVFKAGTACMQFSYFMYGRTVGELKVQIVAPSSKNVVWQKVGNQGKRWQKAKVSVSSNVNYQVAFVGIKGSTWSSDIAIDDVVFNEEQC